MHLPLRHNGSQFINCLPGHPKALVLIVFGPLINFSEEFINLAEWPMQQVSRLKIAEWPFLLPLLSLRPIRAAVRLTMGRVGCQTSQVCFCSNTRKRKKGGEGGSIEAECGLLKREMADDYIVCNRGHKRAQAA